MALHRTCTADEVDLVTYGGAVRHHWEPAAADQSYSMTIHLDPGYNAHLSPSKNPVNPPYHWHYRQREDFLIKSGTVIFTIEGKDVLKTKSDGPFSIEPGVNHTFRADPDSPEEITMVISAPKEPGVEEGFLRNLFSYMEDCNEQKSSPNVFQVFLFLHSSESYPVLPGPKAIAHPLSQLLVWFLGVAIGKHVLGLKESYDEYYHCPVTQQ